MEEKKKNKTKRTTEKEKECRRGIKSKWRKIKRGEEKLRNRRRGKKQRGGEDKLKRKEEGGRSEIRCRRRVRSTERKTKIK